MNKKINYIIFLLFLVITINFASSCVISSDCLYHFDKNFDGYCENCKKAVNLHYTCPKCGAVNNEDVNYCHFCGYDLKTECIHVWADATCTLPKRCMYCDETIGSPLGHTEVTDEAVAPTCMKTGLTEGSHCSVCNEIIKAQEEIKPLGHSWKEATKQEPKTCTICGKTEGTKLKGCKKASIASIILSVNLLSGVFILLKKHR